MTNPTFIPEAWATDADPAFINTIPTAPSATAGRASLSLGFPPITMQPVIAGGIPPQGQDFNGILNLLSAHTVFSQAGGIYNFSQAWVDAGNEYNSGDLVRSADGSTIWMCNFDGITDDPDGAGSTRWTSIANVKTQAAIALTSGTVALTALQAAAPILIFQGTLTGNVRVNLPRHQVRTWIVVNLCVMGAFSLIVGTSVGTGVAVPAGGYASPSALYSEGVNVFPSNANVGGVPVDQAANPLTIAERDNTGQIYATRFNQSSALENPTIDAVICQSAGDGFFRKISKANFGVQLPVASLAGQVLAAQVPLAAVSQWAASIFANAALTGNPTAPTAPVGDSDTSIATTAFANPGQSQTANGYVQFPGGMILQWGFAQGAAGPGATTVNFPIAFPSACLAAVCATANRTGAGSNGYNFVNALTVNGFTAWFDVQQSGAGNGNRGGYWFAIGF